MIFIHEYWSTGARKAKEDSGNIITPIGREFFIDQN
jgi:hypothetical protein